MVNDNAKTVNALTQLLKSEPAAVSFLKPGDLIQGTVLQKGASRIFIDLGKHGTGAVYKHEMQNAKEIIKGLAAGDTIFGKVVEVDNMDGYVELSLAEAGKQKAWAEILELQEKEEIVEVRPTGYNKGGLIVAIKGLQAFLPTSQLSSEHYTQAVVEDKAEAIRAFQGFVGTPLSVKIIEVNPRSNKLIVSERAAHEISQKELVKNYAVGQVVECVILGVADFGAFVRFTDNPQVEGFIHVSELDHRIVANPKEVVKVDDVVKAKIIEIKEGKVYLSLKTLKPDPWETVAPRYSEGMEVTGMVYNFNPFGAIVSLDDQIQGQLHVAQFGSVEEMKKQLALGKAYSFLIESVQVPEKRIVLKLKK